MSDRQQEILQILKPGTKSELLDECETRLVKRCEEYDNMDRRYNRISVIRLIVFLILIAGIVLLFLKQWWAVLIVAAAAGMFAWLVIVHGRLEQEQKMIHVEIQVLKQWIAKGKMTWDELADTGAQYLEEDNYVAKDLDLLGSHSLYQLICTAHTPEGKKCLAEALLGAEQARVEKKVILGRQEAIRELTGHPEFRLRYETLSYDQEVQVSGKSQVAQSKEIDEQGERDSQQQLPDRVAPVITVLSYVIPVLFLLSIVGSAVRLCPPAFIPGVYFVGLFLSFLLSGYCAGFMEPVFGQQNMLRSKFKLMEIVTEEQFASDWLTGLQREIVNDTDRNAMHGMKRLERLLAFYHLRHNPIVHFLLSGIFLYDVHLARASVAWNRTYRDQIREVMGVLAQLEMLNSFALFASYQECCYPTIDYQDQTPRLQIRNGYHPFLTGEQAVKNSIELDARPRVITGSNMSGKTTFLRTLGINVILAYAGAPVCADSMDLSVMRPFTSMRVTDDVNHGISTFYAEILRIKEMVEYGDQKRPMLCLIDEIFKGTNSADRVVGAEAVLKRLTSPMILPIISTHDFELCELADNYHFEEYYDEEGIHFDYRLRTDRCRTTNALYLLKLAGLN